MQSDLIERYRLATAEHAEAEAMVGRAADRRARACADLHCDGWSFARIGRELGLSRSRVQQLVERGRTVDPEQVEPTVDPEPEQVEQIIATEVLKLRRQTDPRTAGTFYTWSHPAGVELEIRWHGSGRERYLKARHLPESVTPAHAEWADPTFGMSRTLNELRVDLDEYARALSGLLAQPRGTPRERLAARDRNGPSVGYP